jgi:hypothetical protein
MILLLPGWSAKEIPILDNQELLVMAPKLRAGLV